MGDCIDGACGKCRAAKLIVFGILIFVFAWKWPQYIWHAIGIALIVKGVMKLAMPNCPHCGMDMPKKNR